MSSITFIIEWWQIPIIFIGLIIGNLLGNVLVKRRNRK